MCDFPLHSYFPKQNHVYLEGSDNCSTGDSSCITHRAPCLAHEAVSRVFGIGASVTLKHGEVQLSLNLRVCLECENLVRSVSMETFLSFMCWLHLTRGSTASLDVTSSRKRVVWGY